MNYNGNDCNNINNNSEETKVNTLDINNYFCNETPKTYTSFRECCHKKKNGGIINSNKNPYEQEDLLKLVRENVDRRMNSKRKEKQCEVLEVLKGL